MCEKTLQAESPSDLVSPVDVGDLLDGGAPRHVSFHNHAAQRRRGVSVESWLDQVKLTGGPIAEEQQHVLTEFVADQPGNRRDLGLVDTLSLRVGEGDAENLYSSEARNTFGEGRQFDAGSAAKNRSTRSSTSAASSRSRIGIWSFSKLNPGESYSRTLCRDNRGLPLGAPAFY